MQRNRLDFHDTKSIDSQPVRRNLQRLGFRNMIITNSASSTQIHRCRGPYQLAASLKSVLPWSVVAVLHWQDHSGAGAVHLLANRSSQPPTRSRRKLYHLSSLFNTDNCGGCSSSRMKLIADEFGLSPLAV